MMEEIHFQPVQQSGKLVGLRGAFLAPKIPDLDDALKQILSPGELESAVHSSVDTTYRFNRLYVDYALRVPADDRSIAVGMWVGAKGDRQGVLEKLLYMSHGLIFGCYGIEPQCSERTEIPPDLLHNSL